MGKALTRHCCWVPDFFSHEEDDDDEDEDDEDEDEDGKGDEDDGDDCQFVMHVFRDLHVLM